MHSHTHTHTSLCARPIYTHLEGLHGFTWMAGTQPRAAANNPSSHFSPGSVSAVHLFTALPLKRARVCVWVCVCAGVNVCASDTVMCHKIKCWQMKCVLRHGTTVEAVYVQGLIPATLWLVMGFIFKRLHLLTQHQLQVMYCFSVCICVALLQIQRATERKVKV